MKKLIEKADEKRFTRFLLYGTATAVMGMILYPLLDYLFYTFITRSPFEYSVFQHIVEPIIFGYTFGLVFSAGNLKSNKKSKK